MTTTFDNWRMHIRQLQSEREKTFIIYLLCSHTRAHKNTHTHTNTHERMLTKAPLALQNSI